MRFVVTEHAVERFRARVRPDLPPDGARSLLESVAPASSALRERTFSGQEQRQVDEPRCVLVCKRDPGAIVVVTVLGAGEILSEVDEETLDRWRRHVVDAVARKAIKIERTETRPRRVEARVSSEGYTRQIVEKVVAQSLGKIVDELVAAETNRRAQEEAKATAAEDTRRRIEANAATQVEIVARKEAAKTERMRLFEEAKARLSDRAVKIAIPALAELADAGKAGAVAALKEILEIDPTIAGLIRRKTDAA